MSRPARTAIDQLIQTLDLKMLGEDHYQGESPQIGWQRIFGGQVIAQALVAAQRSVAATRPVHSLHAYFMRPGDPSTPVDYAVERLRDGTTFSTRRVVATQHRKAIFAMSASFQDDEEGFAHQIAMPELPMPEALMNEAQLRDQYLAHAPEPVRRYWERERPIEIRPTAPQDFFSRSNLEPVQNVWVRTTAPVPDDRQLQTVILAYLSDMTLLDTSLYAHGTSVFDRTLQVASLDHAMWFHRPFKLDDWLLYVQDSPTAFGGRGMTRGSLFARSGELIASVAQEGLIRKKANA